MLEFVKDKDERLKITAEVDIKNMIINNEKKWYQVLLIV